MATHGKRLAIALILLTLVCATMTVFAGMADKSAAISAGQNLRQPAPVAPEGGKLFPMGIFTVSVQDGQTWKPAGELKYDKYFVERKLALGLASGNEKTITVRLEEKGGGAAHLDSVLLDGKKPRQINGKSEPFFLKKLGKKDYDVVDAFGKSFEFTFDRPQGKTAILRVTGRVEGERLEGKPFMFPSVNQGKAVDAHSTFYTYTLGSHRLTPEIDGAINEISTLKPLFKQYCRSVTGHPSAYTYGWVTNDDKNLYVSIDFTGDNTMDGNEDYAGVYVKTATGVKLFKASANQKKWGANGFNYTSRVPYQHKTYELKIPLSEIGMNAASGKTVTLACTAYGTAGGLDGDEVEGVLAYDPVHARYLSVFMRLRVKEGVYWSEIYGRFLEPDGTLYGNTFLISSVPEGVIAGEPAVCFDYTGNRFLVVWSDERNATESSPRELYGQFIQVQDTTPELNNFLIHSSVDVAGTDIGSPSVAYDGANNKFLVTWDENSGSPTDQINILGCLISADGAVGDYFAINNNTAYIPDYYPSQCAYDFDNQWYLVVWQDSRGGSYDVYGQYVNADGSLKGDNFAFETDTADSYDIRVAYNNIAKNFMVTWRLHAYVPEEDSEEDSIKGAVLQYDDSPTPFNLITEAEDNEELYNGGLTFNPANNRYAISWERYKPTAAPDDDPTEKIFYAFLEPDGSIIEGPTTIVADPVAYLFDCAVASNPVNSNFMVSATDAGMSGGEVKNMFYHVIGEPSTPILVVTPSSLDFGQVSLGTTSDKDVTIANPGSDTLVVDNVAFTGDDADQFTITGMAPIFPVTLQSGESVTITIRFTPLTDGEKNATLTVESDAPINPTANIALTGTGITGTPSPTPTTSPTHIPRPGNTGSSCFFGFLAQGTDQESHLGVLRQFRDRYLASNEPGRRLIALYYSQSPLVISKISGNSGMVSFLRCAVVPIYAGAYLLVYSLIWLPLLVIGAAALYIGRRRVNLNTRM